MTKIILMVFLMFRWDVPGSAKCYHCN